MKETALIIPRIAGVSRALQCINDADPECGNLCVSADDDCTAGLSNLIVFAMVYSQNFADLPLGGDAG